ncbi:hypothetical protein [Rhizobium rhizosphaerae]|uniref:hypothetical protein n=1 Tax=Xaviernesmea rhizosphaerae TaxID=1672749 RepID=UPI00111A1046|nr:hypothetical protein [Xaviernesmea rhizosphaerae]
MALMTLGPSGPLSSSLLQTLRARAHALWSRLQEDRERRAFEALPYDVLKDIGFRAQEEHRRD